MTPVSILQPAATPRHDHGAADAEAARALRDALVAQRIVCGGDVTWPTYGRLVAAVDRVLSRGVALGRFEYVHCRALQAGTPRALRRDYPVRLAYTERGAADAPVVICLGGIANVARRFDVLGRRFCGRFRVVCLDWAGRGASGWMAEQSDYTLAAYCAQLDALVRHLDCGPVHLLGSSLGGAVATRFACRSPALVRSIVLNDFGPFIPRVRRARRARAVARHYVFRRPADLFRRIGAAERNDGPVDDSYLLHVSHHLTRWSDEEDGRVYRHDLRALLAYREEARAPLDLWHDWEHSAAPVLLVHGMESDALSARTIARMRRRGAVTVLHVPNTGHTPSLSVPSHADAVARWLASPDSMPPEAFAPAIAHPDRVLFRAG